MSFVTIIASEKGQLDVNHLHLEKTGKLDSVQSAAGGCNSVINHRLCVSDIIKVDIIKNGLRFLIYTGANISLVPRKLVRSKNKQCKSADYKLYAANNTEIQTFGVFTMELNLKLRRTFTWTFVIADVSQPIIGADFLAHYELMVDLSGRKLIDKVPSLNVLDSIVHTMIYLQNTRKQLSRYRSKELVFTQ